LIRASPRCRPRRRRSRRCNGGMHVSAKQFLKDLAFTLSAALGTGALVGGVSFLVVRFFAV